MAAQATFAAEPPHCHSWMSGHLACQSYSPPSPSKPLSAPPGTTSAWAGGGEQHGWNPDTGSGPCGSPSDLSQAIPQLVPQAALDKARVPTALTQAECWNESPGEVYHSQTSPFLSRTRKISQPPPPSFLSSSHDRPSPPDCATLLLCPSVATIALGRKVTFLLIRH